MHEKMQRREKTTSLLQELTFETILNLRLHYLVDVQKSICEISHLQSVRAPDIIPELHSHVTVRTR